MSSGSYSANQDRDDYGQGGYRQYSASAHTETPQPPQPPQDGMTTQPSVGRFTEKEKARSSMFSRKPATPVLPPPNNSLLSDGSASQSSSTGGIVNLRAAPALKDR